MTIHRQRDFRDIPLNYKFLSQPLDLLGKTIIKIVPASLPNLPCAIHVSDSEAYFTGVELSFGCYSIGVKSFVLYLTGVGKPWVSAERKISSLMRSFVFWPFCRICSVFL